MLAQKIVAVGSASADASTAGVALAELLSDHAKGDFEMSCPMAALDLKVCQMIVDHVRAVDEAKVLVLQSALSRCASEGEKLLHAFTQSSGGKAVIAQAREHAGHLCRLGSLRAELCEKITQLRSLYAVPVPLVATPHGLQLEP